MTAQAALGRLTSPDARARAVAARRKRRRRALGWSAEHRRGQGPAAYGRRVATPFRVHRAVPPGHRVAVDLRHWLAAVREAALTDFRADAAERRICLAAVLARHTDWATATARTGWGLLADRGCVSRSTVARFLAWLRARDLLGVVSTGRVGSLTRPMALTGPAVATTPPPGGTGPTAAADGTDTGAGPGSAGGEWVGNEAAVYVLVEPIPTPRPVQEPDPGLLALDPRYTAGLIGVDPHGRAVDLTRLGPLAADQLDDPALAGLRRHHLRTAREHEGVERTDTPKMSRGAGTQSARGPACSRCHRLPSWPLRGANNAAPRQHLSDRADPTPPPGPKPAAQTTTPPPPGQPDRLAQPGQTCRCRGQWSRNAPAHTRRDRLRLVERLRAIAPDLAAIGSTHLLRHLLRPWLLVGWTINDVFHAIENHPTTGLRPHSPTITTTGPGAVRNPAGWLLTRMRDWTQPDGTPTPSHATRTQHAIATRTAAETRQRHTDNQTKAARVPPTPAWTAARAALRDRLHATTSTST